MTTKWWRLSAVGEQSIPETERDTGTHPWSETQSRRENCASAVVVSALSVIISGILLFETLSVGMGGERGRDGHLFVMHQCLVTEEA